MREVAGASWKVVELKSHSDVATLKAALDHLSQEMSALNLAKMASTLVTDMKAVHQVRLHVQRHVEPVVVASPGCRCLVSPRFIW